MPQVSKQPDFALAKAYILIRMQEELPRNLSYHAIQHTFEDVLPAAERLAALSGLNEQDTLLLRTAALYHDIGYIESYDANEAIAARIARESLPKFGYQPEQIEVIVGAIMATSLPQAPKTDLEALLCDADLDSLGREDYFDAGRKFWLELQEYSRGLTRRQWHERQIKLLSTHQYFSQAARDLRDAGKQRNLAELQRRLAEL
ncbi:MAG: HD domain-containing protein [Anaerolineales bacterium]|nr:HD domain-containing protein [Anaerolineales bacterium]